MHNQRLADDVARSHPGVQGTVWVLENNLHLATHTAHFCGRELVQFSTLKYYLPACRLIKLENTPAGGGLAAAAFAHQTQSLTAFDRETNTVYSFYISGGFAR